MALVAAQPPVRGTAILFLNIVGSTVPPPPPVTADVVSGSTVKDVTVAVRVGVDRCIPAFFPMCFICVGQGSAYSTHTY